MPKENILGKLLKIQGVLISLPDENSIYRFVCDNLGEVPGIKQVEHFTKKTTSAKGEKFIEYEIRHHVSEFGTLRIYVENINDYVNYEPYVKDFIYVLAIVLEERLQRKVINVHQEEQEELIAKRTHEVTVYRDSLGESRRRFSEMIENVNLFSVVLDCKGNLTYCNTFLLESTGYTITEIIGKNWYDTFIHPKEREVIKKVFGVIIQGGECDKHHENKILSKSGGEILISWYNSVLLNRKNNIVGIASIGENITEKRRAENDLIEQRNEYQRLYEEYQANNNELIKANKQITELNNFLTEEKEKLEQSEIKFETLYKNTPVMLQSANMKGEIVSVNDTWLQQMGYTYDEVIGTKSSVYLTHESQELYGKLIDTFIKNGSLENVDAQVCTKDGRIIDLLITSKILYDKANKPILTMTNLLDISYKKEIERKQAKLNEQLRIAKERAEEGDSLKTAFLQNLSHEIRTPLNAICGFSQILLKQHSIDAKQKKYHDIINNSSTQLLSIVSNILTISSLETKQEVLKITEFELNNALKELRTIYTNQIGNNPMSVRLVLNFPDEQSLIYTDGTKLTQIITNLLNNAIKFTKEGEIEFGYTRKGEKLEFFVKDSGIGIAPNKKNTIFERFRQANDSVTRDYGGTGLGLAISKAFVELMGGAIWVESELGEGSTFFFTIPLKQTP